MVGIFWFLCVHRKHHVALLFWFVAVCFFKINMKKSISEGKLEFLFPTFFLYLLYMNIYKYAYIQSMNEWGNETVNDGGHLSFWLIWDNLFQLFNFRIISIYLKNNQQIPWCQNCRFCSAEGHVIQYSILGEPLN